MTKRPVLVAVGGASSSGKTVCVDSVSLDQLTHTILDRCKDST